MTLVIRCQVSLSSHEWVQLILRLSAKLAKKIHMPLTGSLPLADDPFGDWHAHLFTVQRVQYILVTHSSTLYSVLFYGKGVTDDNRFLDDMVSTMREYICQDLGEFFFRRFMVPTMGTFFWSKANDRRVIGSMNDFVDQSQYHLEADQLSPWEMAGRLNETPISIFGYEHTKIMFGQLVKEMSDKEKRKS